MGYYYESEKTLDTSGVFPTLKGCVAAAELVSERDKTAHKVYAQTSEGDMLVGKTGEWEVEDIFPPVILWVFDFDPDWPFSKEL